MTTAHYTHSVLRDTIRDEDVWRHTEERAWAVGSFSLGALFALGARAKSLVREKIRKHTGIEVDL